MRPTTTLAALLALAACSEPISDPLDEFRHDPSPVLGSWEAYSRRAP